MKTLTFEVQDNDVDFVMNFARRLGINVYGYQKELSDDEIQLYRKIIEKGVTESSIEDPVAWQREQRKSKPLPFRE